jgi:hypothetical protein
MGLWNGSSVLLILLLLPILGSLPYCQASNELEIFCSISPQSALKLLQLVRGGTIHSAYDPDAEDNRRLFYSDLDDHGQWPKPSASLRRSASIEANSSQEKPLSFNNRRHRPLDYLDYRDVLQCRSPWSSDLDFDEPDGGVGTGLDDESLFSTDDEHSDVDYRGKLDGNRKLLHSPVVYQYHGRSRVRGSNSDSIHFILLGPNVDHWKAVGQVLASRGFNVIACERVESEDSRTKVVRTKDSPNLVLEILDALNWNKVILVGCDNESVLAMETAMILSPDRVAGLVLSGDTKEADRLASNAGVDTLDSFLRRVLDCPFIIVWDGDSPTVVPGSSAHTAMKADADSSDRCLILGGGSAPHRLKPEQFAWLLTRFVEEKLEFSLKKTRITNDGLGRARNKASGNSGQGLLQALNLPFGINTMVSPEGRLLLGRAVAAALFYIIAMKVVVIQYGILRAGLTGIKSSYDSVDAVRKKVFQATAAFVLNYGYIPRLFKLKKAADDDDEDERLGGTVFVGPKQSIVNEENEVEKGESDDSEMKEEEENEEDETANSEDEKIEDGEPLPDDQERHKFRRPFFFLDNVVT